eukprot:12046421-Ditylum_brightwellii.AAC.1
MDKDNGKDIITPEIQVMDQIKMAGEKDIAMKVLQESKLCLEFNIGKNTDNFNGREQLLTLLNQIAIADTTVYAKSYLDGMEWMIDKVFPAGDVFVKESSICQQTNTRRYTIMVAYLQIVHMKT